MHSFYTLLSKEAPEQIREILSAFFFLLFLSAPTKRAPMYLRTPNLHASHGARGMDAKPPKNNLKAVFLSLSLSHLGRDRGRPGEAALRLVQPKVSLHLGKRQLTTDEFPEGRAFR